jgi:hypothetical protein
MMKGVVPEGNKELKRDWRLYKLKGYRGVYEAEVL